MLKVTPLPRGSLHPGPVTYRSIKGSTLSAVWDVSKRLARLTAPRGWAEGFAGTGPQPGFSLFLLPSPPSFTPSAGVNPESHILTHSLSQSLLPGTRWHKYNRSPDIFFSYHSGLPYPLSEQWSKSVLPDRMFWKEENAHYGSHQPHVAMEHLNVISTTEEVNLNYLSIIDLHLNSHIVTRSNQ